MAIERAEELQEENWILIGRSNTPGDWGFVARSGDKFVMVTDLNEASRFTAEEAIVGAKIQTLPGLVPEELQEELQPWYTISPVQEDFAEYLAYTFKVHF